MGKFFICDRCIADTNVGKYNETDGYCERCECLDKRSGAYVTMQELSDADKLGNEPATGLFWQGTVRSLNVAYSHAVCPHCGSNVIDRMKRECMEGGEADFRYSCRNCLRPLRLNDWPVGIGDIVDNINNLVKWLDLHKVLVKVGEVLEHRTWSGQKRNLTLCEDKAGRNRHYLFFMDMKTAEVVGNNLLITNIHHSTLVGASKVVIDKMLSREIISAEICQWPIRK